MTKQHIAIAVIAAVALVATAGAAVYKYDHRAHIPAGISIQEALNERQDAINSLTIERETFQTQVATANSKTQSVQAQLGNVCASLKTTKVVNANCK